MFDDGSTMVPDLCGLLHETRLRRLNLFSVHFRHRRGDLIPSWLFQLVVLDHLSHLGRVVVRKHDGRCLGQTHRPTVLLLWLRHNYWFCRATITVCKMPCRIWWYTQPRSLVWESGWMVTYLSPVGDEFIRSGECSFAVHFPVYSSACFQCSVEPMNWRPKPFCRQQNEFEFEIYSTLFWLLFCNRFVLIPVNRIAQAMGRKLEQVCGSALFLALRLVTIFPIVKINNNSLKITFM